MRANMAKTQFAQGLSRAHAYVGHVVFTVGFRLGEKGLGFFTRQKRAMCVLLWATLVLLPNFGNAVGVGAAAVESRLGEPLNISIPVFSVGDPNSLVISITSEMFGDTPSKRLSARLERANSQLSVRVFTDWPVMEPYISFSLELQDGGTRQAKDFVSLLEFRPSTGVKDPLRVSAEAGNVSTAAPQSTVFVQDLAVTTSSAKPVNKSVMGPYDWAEPGQVPGAFGPVLDGQSLWRVARRINKAMGVSVEQMMVALFDANPDAFYSDAIGSLKAGAILTIPAEQIVASLSAKAAKQRVDSPANFAPHKQSVDSPDIDLNSSVAEPVAATTPAVKLLDEDVEPAQQPARPESEAVVASDNRQLFRIGDAPELGEQPQGDNSAKPNLFDARDAANSQQKIIDSLSQTIGDLMRDNVEKDQRLLAIDERLKALEATLDNVGLASAEVLAKSPLPGDAGLTRWWLWLLPLVAGLGLWLGLRARPDLTMPAADGLFEEQYEDDIEPPTVHVDGDQFEEPVFQEYYGDTDFSALRSNRSKNHKPADIGGIDGVAFFEFKEDLQRQVPKKPDESDITLELDTSNVAEFPSGAEQSLNDIIDGFIAEEDFSAARDVLDAARGNQLDEPNYHFQRLRILLEKEDEHGFYEYFNLVENKFDDVDRELKSELADLVSRLN